MQADTLHYNYLFNISADPFEKHNLYYEDEYVDVRTGLEEMARKTFHAQFYTPEYPFGGHDLLYDTSVTDLWYDSGGFWLLVGWLAGWLVACWLLVGWLVG